jgi:hypothetical protein
MTTSIESAGNGMASMVPLRNSTFVALALAAFVAGKCEHLVGHVQTKGAPGRADPERREQHVDATAGAEVEDP